MLRNSKQLGQEEKRMRVLKQLEIERRNNFQENQRHKMEEKANALRIQQRLHQERQEVAIEESLARAQESQDWRANEWSQEEQLAYQMDLVKRREWLEEKERQRLAESREIVLLKDKIQQGYFKKALMAQLEESSTIDNQRKLDDEYYKNLYERQMISFQLYEEELERHNEQRKIEYRCELQDQIIDNHKKKILAYQDRLHDMALIDDAVRVIRQEEKQEEENRMMMRDIAKKEREAYTKAREMWILNEKHKEEEEEKRIQTYLCDRYEKERKLQDQNRQKADAYIHAQKMVVKKISEIEGKKEEKDRIAKILMEEESRLKDLAEQQKKKDKILKSAQELRETVKMQLEYKKAQIEYDKNLDLMYRKQAEEELERNKKEEQENLLKQKKKKQDYGAELRAGINLLQQNNAREKFIRAAEYEGLVRERNDYLRKVDEERIRLLNLHGPNLVGYLPKGIIHETDLPHLKPEIQECLKAKNK